MAEKQNTIQKAVIEGQFRPLFNLPVRWFFCLSWAALFGLSWIIHVKYVFAADFYCTENIPCSISITFDTQDPEYDPLTVLFSANPTTYTITSCELDGNRTIPPQPALTCLTPQSAPGPGPYTATGYYKFQQAGTYTANIQVCDESGHCGGYYPVIEVAPLVFDWETPDHVHPNATTISWQWKQAPYATSYDIRVNGTYVTTVPQSSSPVRWNQLLVGYNVSSGTVNVSAVLVAGVYRDVSSGPRTHYTQANLPGSPTCTVNSSSQITWNWTMNSNPLGTNFYASNLGGNSGWITATSWVQSGLTPNTPYTTLIKARNNDNEETSTVSVSCTTSAGDTAGPAFTFNPTNQMWSASDILVNLTATDPSGVRYARYCWTTGAVCDPLTTLDNISPFACTGMSPCAATVSQTNNGGWTLCARGMDNLNNWTTPAVCSGPYQMDAALPTSTITAPPANSWQRVNFSVSVTDVDTGGSGLTSCLYGVRSWNGSSWVQTVADTTLRSCNTPFTITVGALSNCRDQGSNSCEIRVRSMDAAGNLSSVSTRLFSIDWTSPTPSPPSITASGQTNTSITWTLSTGSDAHSGLDPLPYRFSRTSGGPYTSAVQASPAWLEGGLSCGTNYTRYGVIQDLAGNMTSQGAGFGSTLPCPPGTPANFTGSTNYSTSQIRWSWSASSGAETYYVYSNPDGVFQCVASAPTTFCVSPTGAPYLNPNTALTAHVFAQNSGGVSGWSNDATGYTTPGPVTNLVASFIGATALTWTWGPPNPDGGAGLDYRCSFDGGTLSACTSPYTAGSLLCNTTHTINVYARNPLTNVLSAVVTDTKTTSGCTPATITMNPVNRSWASSNISATITAADTDGIVYVRYCWGNGVTCIPLQTDGNDAPFTCSEGSPCSAVVTQSSDGNWFLCARAKDGSNTWNDPPVCSGPYQKDAVAPSPAAGAPNCSLNPNNTGTHTCIWTAAGDALSGVSSYYVYQSAGGGSYQLSSPAQPAPVNGTSWTPSPALPQNSYQYRVLTLDVAGNAVTGAASSVIIVDKTAPTITAFSPQFTPTAARPVLNWTAIDAGGSNLSKFELWRADYNTSNCNGINMSGCSWSLRVDNIGASATGQEDISTITTGTYWYGLHALDSAGNCITESGTNCGGPDFTSRSPVGPDQVIFDNEAPKPNPPTLTATNITDSSITWTLSLGVDAPAGLHATAYGIGPSVGNYTFRSANSWTENGLPCGANITRYGVIRDVLGNQTNPASATFRTADCVGRSASLSINPMPTSGWAKLPTSVTLNPTCVAEGGQTLQSCTAQVNVNNTGWVDVPGPYPVTYVSFTAGRSYQFRAREQDTGGSIASNPIPNPAYQFDNVPPNQVVVAVTNSPTGGPDNTPLNIAWLASADAHSGLDHYEVWRSSNLGNGPNPSGWVKVGGNIPIGTLNINDTPPYAGIWWYGIHILDKAGNLSTESNPPGPAVGVWDNVPPVLTSMDPLNETKELRPIIQAHVSDNLTGISSSRLTVISRGNGELFTKDFGGESDLIISNDEWIKNNWPVLPNGIINVYVTSVDGVGNTLFYDKWTFEVNNSPPEQPTIR